jgi:hypothetical protein
MTTEEGGGLSSSGPAPPSRKSWQQAGHAQDWGGH